MIRKLWFRWRYGRGRWSTRQGSQDHVLFLRHDRIGDLAVMWPFIRLMRDHWELESAHILLSHANAALLKYESWLQQHVVPYGATPREICRSIAGLKGKIDVVVDPFYSRWGRVLKVIDAVSPKCVIGFEKENRYGLSVRGLGYESAEPVRLSGHTTLADAFRRLYNRISGETITIEDYYANGLLETGYHAHRVRDFMQGQLAQVPFVLLNISGYGDYKCMHIEAVTMLATHLERRGMKVVITGSTEHLERLRQQGIDGRTDAQVLWQDSSILDVVELIQHAKAVITVDTSVVHLAELATKPMLGFYVPEKMVDELFLPSLPSSRHQFVNRLDRWTKADIDRALTAIDQFITEL